jgi:hypothetical protein
VSGENRRHARDAGRRAPDDARLARMKVHQIRTHAAHQRHGLAHAARVLSRVHVAHQVRQQVNGGAALARRDGKRPLGGGGEVDLVLSRKATHQIQHVRLRAAELGKRDHIQNPPLHHAHRCPASAMTSRYKSRCASIDFRMSNRCARSCACPTHARAQLTVLQQLFQARGQLWRRRPRAPESGRAVFADDFAQPRHVAAHDRQAARHGLGLRPARSLPSAKESENRRAISQRGSVRAEAKYLHLLAQLQLVQQRLDFLSRGRRLGCASDLVAETELPQSRSRATARRAAG